MDDNADIRRTLLRLLEILGCQVFEAESGQQGLEAIDRHSPDVALVDIGMPGLDGYETARRIRGLPAGRGIVLVAITGFGQREDRERAFEAGFNSHLVKPIDLEELSRVVMQQL